MTKPEARSPGRRVLVVEDDYFVADSLALALKAHGIDVLGPVANVDEALELIARDERIDGAILDVNLKGELVFSVGDVLRTRGVPYVFTTGYDASSVARHAGGAPCFEKPVPPAQLIDALFGEH